MTPNGTPSPTPIVVSCELLVGAGAGIDEFDELDGDGDGNEESGGTRYARAARPVRTWASASRKLSVSSRQTVSLPLATGVPQQYLELPLMVLRVTIAEPLLLSTVPDAATY
ncbi:hypothetical protein F1880_006875 [Penicillium rolfsii]|nr:hypothetical protein F1880_006875 [Penicillium rolfsii]